MQSVRGVLLRVWVVGMLVLATCGSPDGTRSDGSELSEDEAGDPDGDDPALAVRDTAASFGRDAIEVTSHQR